MSEVILDYVCLFEIVHGFAEIDGAFHHHKTALWSAQILTYQKFLWNFVQFYKHSPQQQCKIGGVLSQRKKRTNRDCKIQHIHIYFCGPPFPFELPLSFFHLMFGQATCPSRWAHG